MLERSKVQQLQQAAKAGDAAAPSVGGSNLTCPACWFRPAKVPPAARAPLPLPPLLDGQPRRSVHRVPELRHSTGGGCRGRTSLRSTVVHFAKWSWDKLRRLPKVELSLILPPDCQFGVKCEQS